jgi:hypothetical protein
LDFDFATGTKLTDGSGRNYPNLWPHIKVFWVSKMSSLGNKMATHYSVVFVATLLPLFNTPPFDLMRLCMLFSERRKFRAGKKNWFSRPAH